MKRCPRTQPIRAKEIQQKVMDFKAHPASQETLALLKLLALGSRQFEAGQFRSADAVFADLDALDT
ncbi:MAG: hypothetical protein B7Z35_08110 [Hydrogenophilales bacterium 12-61-10]|nr:MAG: hypothetical protein B7Z35_08110 [Hydrogenophilales bacterium 12-61-10]